MYVGLLKFLFTCKGFNNSQENIKQKNKEQNTLIYL